MRLAFFVAAFLVVASPDHLPAQSSYEHREIDAAIENGLSWLASNQHKDGYWPINDPKGSLPIAIQATANHELQATALAILAYLGYGHTHKDGEHREYRDVVLRATDWLLSQQTIKGSKRRLGQFRGKKGKFDATTQAMATMALAEMLVLSRDRNKLVEPVTMALNACFRAQNEGKG